MPVGECREADSRPDAIIPGIHDRGLRGGGNAGLDMEKDEVADNPGQANRSGDESEQCIIPNREKEVLSVFGSDGPDKIQQENKS